VLSSAKRSCPANKSSKTFESCDWGGKSEWKGYHCRGNAEEIVSSLQELEAMREGTEELRERVTDGDAMLREAGTTFLNGLEQLQDLRRVESFVAASCQVCFLIGLALAKD
jgi:hypothetical protein